MYVKEKNTFSVKRTAGLTDDRSKNKFIEKINIRPRLSVASNVIT